MAAPGIDPDSLRYARYWEPLLAAPGRRMLARIGDTPACFLDIGTGTGSLLLMAATRWPAARLVGLDASAGMLSVARRRATEGWPDDGARFDWLVADATVMPLADGSVDVATAAFVLELVDDRPALLREIGRVLRPGGALGLVVSMAHELVCAADDALASLVAAWGMAGEAADLRVPLGGEYRSLEEVESELAEAGFSSIAVQGDRLHHRWTCEQYLAFKEHYDERDVFESLDEFERPRFRQELRDRWATLPATAFELSGPLVSAVARRGGS